MHQWIEWSSLGIELLAVVTIVGSIGYGFVRFLLDLWKRDPDPYRAYKDMFGRALLLSLEFMIAADLIRTVIVDLTPQAVAMLGALVVIRTFLSWSVVVEIEGHWPWQASALAARSERPGAKNDASG